MDIKATFSCRRQPAFEIFNRLLFQGRLHSWARALLSGKRSLDDFAAQLPHLNPNRKYAGVQDILLDRITGSVGRVKDFDREFLPLKKHLADRWVANYLFMQEENWPTIRVYQVGSQYFVEDGHHRVSVARSRGMAYIQAEVWEYEMIESPALVPVAPRLVKESTRPSQAACSCEALPIGN